MPYTPPYTKAERVIGLLYPHALYTPYTKAERVIGLLRDSEEAPYCPS